MNDIAVKKPRTHGVYRRRIVLHADGARVFAGLEDDFHHMYVDLLHDGAKVTRMHSRTLRIPRSTCPGAVERLREFAGTGLTEGSGGLDARQQCTHLFDIAKLAMAHALRGGRREYVIAVPDPVDKVTRAELRRDGEVVLAWEMRGSRIVAPPPFTGCDLFGKLDWKHFDPDAYEAAMILRRGVWLSFGRSTAKRIAQLKASGQAFQTVAMPTSLKGACYSHQPEHLDSSEQLDDSTIDFSERPDRLLAELASSELPPAW